VIVKVRTEKRSKAIALVKVNLGTYIEQQQDPSTAQDSLAVKRLTL